MDLNEQIKAVEREIGMRARVYPAWVRGGKMSQAKADHETAAMQAVLKTLQQLRDGHLAPADAPITGNDRRWRHLEHGCQWVSWTETGGETHSFDPRHVPGLTAMRDLADEQSARHIAAMKALIAQNGPQS